MPQINLTTLSGQELRQRLDSSRARGDAALAYEILQEMAARRAAETRKRPLLKRRPAEPRIVDVDLRDPLDRDDELPPMPYWRGPEIAAAPQPPEADASHDLGPPSPGIEEAAELTLGAAAAPADPEPLPRFRLVDPPLTLRDPDPVGDAVEPLDLRMAAGDLEAQDEPPIAAARPRRRGLGVVAGFAAGITAGVAVGWFAADFAATPSLPVQPVQIASRQPAAPAVLEVVTEAAAPPAEASKPLAEASAAAPAAPAEEMSSPDEAPLSVEAAESPLPDHAPSMTDACAAEATPADREICGDPALQRLQRDLRRAYAEALDAHEDRALLRERQLAWRDARNEVTDPVRLARLYEQRIRKLDAAAAEARAQR